MHFDLTDDQRAIVATARAFAQKEMAPFAAEWDANSHFPVDVIRKAECEVILDKVQTA